MTVITGSLLSRISVVVLDIDPLIDFYRWTFGWEVVIDAEYGGDADFPTIAGPPEQATFRIVYLSDDQATPRIGFLAYTDPPFDPAPRPPRTALGDRDVILAVSTDDIAGVVERAAAAGAEILRGPSVREYRSLDGSSVQRVYMASFFDPDGHYVEVNQELDERPRSPRLDS
ncbi:VOC family protein [Nonomuraea bangladeshensis]|uniref:VOC family protein n=1 Tax=Nonomuraea bangladeshensis TaxID=404385 RepID=UPI0031DE24DB